MASEHPTVEYRDIQGFPGYRIGSDGSVWSFWVYQQRPARIGTAGRRLSPNIHRDGHLVVTLMPGRCRRFIHHLVLEAFRGPCPDGMQARHFPDRDPANNALANLSWAPAAVNQQDRVTHDTHSRGARNAHAKLTDEAVRSIRADYAAGGVSQRQLAQRYGVPQGQIWAIIHRRAWAHIA